MLEFEMQCEVSKHSEAGFECLVVVTLVCDLITLLGIDPGFMEPKANMVECISLIKKTIKLKIKIRYESNGFKCK